MMVATFGAQPADGILRTLIICRIALMIVPKMKQFLMCVIVYALNTNYMFETLVIYYRLIIMNHCHT